MSLLDIQCCGKSSSMFVRQKSDKKLARRIFSPIQHTDFQHNQHEIANHYKDFKRKSIPKEHHRRRQSYPAKYLGTQKKRLSLTSSREILQMPCFVFPRFGTNFPWRGRQTLCNQNTTKIESKTLQQINSAVTISDFKKLFLQSYNLSSHLNHSDSTCISSEKNSYYNPLTCHIKKGEVLSDGKPVTSTARITNPHQRKGKTRYNTTTRVGGNESFADETENLEWYIKLASRCYNEGFRWHMNYLNDCTRRSALLKRRRLTGAVSKPNRIEQRNSQSVEHQSQLATDEVSEKNLNEDRFREDISDCKIRININSSLNSNSNNYNGNTRKRSNYSYVAHLNKKINIMNSSGYSIDAINVQNDMKTDRLNEVLDNFGSLNISCGSVLPQIVLTDFSSVDSIPRTSTLLLTPSTEQQFNISGPNSQSHTEFLSIPVENYRNDTRPC